MLDVCNLTKTSLRSPNLSVGETSVRSLTPAYKAMAVCDFADRTATL
jgi:hypothetical protein